MSKSAQTKQKISAYLNKAKIIFLEVFVPHEENNFLPKALKSKYLFWYGASLLIIKIALISLVLILPSTDFFSAITVQQLISMINQERQARSMSALSLNISLNSVADLKINDMLAKDYFDHTSPAGLTPWYLFKQIGYNYAFAGENLAMGFTESGAVFQAWMNSPTHRDNILNPNYQEMGLAVRSGQIQNHADTLAVLVFGKQQTAAPRTQVAQTPVKTNPPAPTPKKTPAISITPSAAPQVKQNELYVTEPKNTPSPSVIPQTTASPAPLALAEQIKLETVPSPQQTEQNSVNYPRVGYAPRVLGAFTSKSDEIFKSLYLYFTLFLAIALAVNIFVKIRIQYWPTIFATTLIIMMSTTLIFI